jgi:hypothetical protein
MGKVIGSLGFLSFSPMYLLIPRTILWSNGDSHASKGEVVVNVGGAEVHDVGLNGFGLQSTRPEKSHPFKDCDRGCRQDGARGIPEVRVSMDKFKERALACGVGVASAGG